MPRSFNAASFADASLVGQRALEAECLESSLDAGWTSTLLGRHRLMPGRMAIETQATPDTRLVVGLKGSYSLDVLRAGRWSRGWYGPGSAGLTAGRQIDRLRCTADLMFEIGDMYIPQQIVSDAAEMLRRAGQSSSECRLSALVFDDPTVITVIGSLFAGMRVGAPDLYADQAMHWLAMYLLVTHGGADNSPRASHTERPVARRLAQVVDMIRLRFAEPLTLNMLAAEAGVSKFHFSRIFKEQTGLAPHAFLTATRMTIARELLASTELTIAQVAHQVGYRRPERFAGTFRTAHGLTPTAFRLSAGRSAKRD